jgi:hypothetical protein
MRSSPKQGQVGNGGAGSNMTKPTRAPVWVVARLAYPEPLAFHRQGRKLRYLGSHCINTFQTMKLLVSWKSVERHA